MSIQAHAAALAWALPRAWRERRMAGRCCRRLLHLYEVTVAGNPRLYGRGLYEHIVARHSGCDARAAKVAVQEAHQSYAAWPVERKLSFRDVVHYLAVREIFMADSATPWAQADVKRVVDASIPRDL